MGVWLDWMAQGAQVTNNLFYENTQWDVFFEVDHGPILFSNNICLSRVSMLLNSSGVAMVHNLFAGPIRVIPYDSRLTPFMRPHSTYMTGLHDNPGGDVRFINNLFVAGANARAYDKSMQGAHFSGNVFTGGANRRSVLKDKTEANEWDAVDYDVDPRLIRDGTRVYLEVSFDKDWVAGRKRTLVTSAVLGRASVPDLPFENPDGTPIRIDTDYAGQERSAAHPSPGPFEIIRGGRQRIRVW
jgi:alpha-N-arabinofuranosidase